MIKSIIILYLLAFNVVFAEVLHIESGIKKNTLIELYTSEGCSSCPPAEKYLNNFTKKKDLWKTWIPVAFHVDYWDYIGWKDRFAEKIFSQRQRQYAQLKRASTVYTPAFMVNGDSWRPGIFSRTLKEEQTQAGKLKVTLDGQTMTAHFKPVNSAIKKSKLNIAILGMDLSTDITRGENIGRHAEHEFVVVGFSSKESSNNLWNISLPALHYSDVKKFALAVWVSHGNDPTPLQAVGSLLPAYK